MTRATPASAEAGHPRIGLLGGSFDPVHVGHLALGQAAAEALQLDELIVIPTGESWQKARPDDPGQTAAAHRLAMVEIAIAPLVRSAARCRWSVDDLEIRRGGPTYTIDTLVALRARVGPAAALVLILGSDQFRNLPTWHRWQALTDYAHLAVTRREQISLADLPAPVERLLAERGRDALPDAAAGSVVTFRMPAVPVSATRLRIDLAAGRPVDELLPRGVADYVREHQLYQSGTMAR